MRDHLDALMRVRDELDGWGDFEQSESWDEHFPEAIENDKTPGVPPHPLWLAVVQLQKYYPKNRLPKLTGALDAWDKLLRHSRQHGTEDRIVQRDLAVENASILRKWVCSETERLMDESTTARFAKGQDDNGHGVSAAAPDKPIAESPTGFLGGEELADALGIHPARREAFLQQLGRQRMSMGDECWREVSEPRPNCPRFLYRVDSPKVRDLAVPYKTPKRV